MTERQTEGQVLTWSSIYTLGLVTRFHIPNFDMAVQATGGYHCVQVKAKEIE